MRCLAILIVCLFAGVLSAQPEIDVQRGDKVKRGQQIARSGMSGDADTPKLHFEVRKNSKPVDPMGYLD